MTYKYYSSTTSGWTIETDPSMPPDKRWRVTHPEYGERFFEEHDDILPFTCKHMMEQIDKRLGKDWWKKL